MNRFGATVAARPRSAVAAAIASLLFVGFDSDAAAQEPKPAGEKPAEAAPSVDVAEVKRRVAAELARGRAADAEDLLREALRIRREPELLLELGAVLVERASQLDDTSDLGASLRQGVLEEAHEVYAEATNTPETTVRAANGAAMCHALLGRHDAAEGTLREVLAGMRTRGAKPEERRLLVRELDRYLTELGRENDARALIEEARAAGELDEANVKLEELRIASAKRDSAQALPLALAAIEAGADGFQVAYLCWDAVGQAQPEEPKAQLEGLLHLYSKLLERRPGEKALLYYRGVTRLRLGDGPGAVTDLAPCVDAPEFGDRARAYLGHSLVRAARAEEAVEPFMKVIASGRAELVPDALNGLIEVAVQRARSRKFDSALELYRLVLASDPANLWARIGEPLCLKSLNQYEKAAAAYEEGLRVLPEEPQLLNDYALLLKALGQRQKAKEMFERALGSGGGRAAADGGENLGIIAYRDDHDPAAAARYFARTLLIDPNRPRVRFYRELCLSEGAK